MTFVALLRGVNVGGANKVPMADLRSAAEGVGFTEVATYINSGNMLFSAERGETRPLAATLEEAIATRFGVRCSVVVRSGGQIREIARAIPDDWCNDSGRRTDVLYLFDSADSEAVLDGVRIRPEIDHVLYTPGALVWMVERRNATRSGLLSVVGTPLYQQVTIRNVNTARKLADLVARRAD